MGPRRLKPAAREAFYRSGEPLRHPKSKRGFLTRVENWPWLYAALKRRSSTVVSADSRFLPCVAGAPAAVGMTTGISGVGGGDGNQHQDHRQHQKSKINGKVKCSG